MITQEYLKSVLTYNPKDGVFVWNKSGKVAGFLKDGYIYIRVNRKSYLAHRLAWLYVYGWIPPMIDHDNRVKTANWINNLKETTPAKNTLNSDRCDNPVEPTRFPETNPVLPVGFGTGDGVCYRRDRNMWRARTRHGKGNRINIGNYKTFEEATRAYNDYVARHKS